MLKILGVEEIDLVMLREAPKVRIEPVQAIRPPTAQGRDKLPLSWIQYVKLATEFLSLIGGFNRIQQLSPL